MNKFTVYFYKQRTQYADKSRKNTVDPGYNDTDYCDTSSIASDILWCQLIPHY